MIGVLMTNKTTETQEEEAIRIYNEIGLDCCGNCKHWRAGEEHCNIYDEITIYTDSCDLCEAKDDQTTI